jgi:hypothetical protein
MKRKLSILSLFIFLFSLCISHAQETNKAEENYLEYFKLPRETLYLHTNKTLYLADEDIWFKAYAFDRKNELTSKTTSNIYLGLYNSEGVQLDKRLYLGQKGVAIGNYTLDSLLPSGEYYLKISTNWMKNFKEDDAYIQKIQVLNPKVSAKETNKISEKEYDFQFLPEGGHILEGVKNTIGIKAIDDEGKGTKSSGVIVNSKNEEVARFSSNVLGIGKFSLIPDSGENYTAKITLESGKEFEQKLPKMDDIGVAITVNNLISDKTIITLSLNQASFDQMSDQQFKLLLHKDGKVKSIPIVFNELTNQIVIAKKDLFKGVNTVTLFNEKEEPILERMFFHHEGAVKNYDFYLSKTGTDFDTIIYKVRTNEVLGEQILNASISVLPGETVSYNPEHNIVSAIHLQPYVQGVIENPQYYFKDFDRKKQFELDALLLTQGWSRYSWDRIFNLPPKPSFDFEYGISVNGFVNNRKNQNITQLFMYPTALNKAKFIPVDEEGRFQMSNFYPQAGEEIRFSYLGNDGKMRKPSMSLSYIKLLGKDNINTQDYQSFFSYYQDKTNIPDQFIIDDSYEELEEIQIKTDYKKKLREESRDPILVNGKVTKVTDDVALRFRRVLDFIQNSGYDVFDGDGAVAPLGSVVILSRSRGQPAAPAIFLDDILVNDINFLTTMTMDQVDRIVVDRTGVGLGLTANNGGFGGAIKIFTRRNILNLNNGVDSVQNMFVSKSNFGFEPVKEFYVPRYASYNLQSFRDYGVIHWDPDLNIYSTTSDDLKVLDTGLDDINFYIEGISSDGSVFSQVIKLDNSNKN